MKLINLWNLLKVWDPENNPDMEVLIEGYKADTDDENRSYDLVHIEGHTNEITGEGITLWGRIRETNSAE